MADFSKIFQRMDETIADVCLRELDWGQIKDWENGSNLQNTRLSEVYRLSRPLILHLIKADKSPMKNMKKLSISRSMLDAGKKNMENNNLYDALNMYNKAVVFAPNIDDNLGKACAERAACLLRLGDNTRALADIQQAELCEYQFERRFELEERRGLAYLGLKQYAEAKTAFTTSISLLEDAAGFLPKKFVERKMQELKDNLKNCIYPRLESGGEVARFSAMKRLPELKSRNRKFPALSEKVEVSQSSHQKRELFSTGEIGAGDILGIEKPVASVLEKEFIRTNCWNCLITLKAPYGCPLCSAVKFCSKDCLREACSTYHPSECLLTDIILSNRFESWHLALRAVGSKPLSQILQVGSRSSGRNGASGLSSSGDLNALLNLDLPLRTESGEEMKKRSIMAVFYLIILQMTGYFDTTEEVGKLNPSLSSIQQMKGKENDSTLSEPELHVATLLEKIIRATSSCSTEICHFEMGGEGEWTTGKVTPVLGRSINPTLAMVPHSCYPTAARVCHANQTLLIAQKNMKSGERVTINYTAPFYAASRSHRKEFLYTGFNLSCECEACRQDWDLFDNLPPGPQGLSDQDFDLKGFKMVEFGNPGKLQVEGFTATERSIVEAFSKVRSKLDQLQRSIVSSGPPSKVMIQNQVRLFRCLLAMYSSKLFIIKTEYGKLSIPV